MLRRLTLRPDRPAADARGASTPSSTISAPDAYERLVDRLLASPQYGERWAQHWLDLARYAETDGFEFDQARPDAWRYRDWVVDALNDDMPYDRVRALAARRRRGRARRPVGVHRHRVQPLLSRHGRPERQGLRRQNALNDITETTGLVFLGLTIGCAGCHDHKFDPIRQADFYRLQAFFTPAVPRRLPIASPAERAPMRRLDAGKRVATSRRTDRLERPSGGADAGPSGLNDETAAAFRGRVERTPARCTGLRGLPRIADRPKVWRWPSTRRRRLPTPAASSRSKRRPPAAAGTGIDEAARAPRPTPAGAIRRKGPRSPRPSRPSPARRLRPRRSRRRRTRPAGAQALADWLARPDHPLTARVIVNRLWQHHFGQGIVATPSDFGTMGAEPTHPELLDWLATEFVARGWSLKAMHRLMVTSATYRQSSRPSRRGGRADPENALAWPVPPARLDGEAIRDALLAVSGQLNPTLGGPCVFPELPAELTKLSSKGAVWPVSDRAEDRDAAEPLRLRPAEPALPVLRGVRPPRHQRELPAPAVTTIAPQALTLLNSRSPHDAAAALAAASPRGRARPRRPGPSSPIRLASAATPTPTSCAWPREFLASGPVASVILCLALINANEFVYID